MNHGLTVNQNYYYQNCREELYKSSEIFDILINSGNYTIASRWSEISSTKDYAVFGLSNIYNQRLNYYQSLFSSDGTSLLRSFNYRPVINISIKYINLETDYDTYGAWNLK